MVSTLLGMVKPVLNGFRILFPCPNPYHRIHRADEDFAVTDFASTGRRYQLVNNHVNLSFIDDNLDFELLEKLNGIFRATVTLCLTLLAAKAPNFRNRHTNDPSIDQGNFYLVQLKGANNRFYFFQTRYSSCNDLVFVLFIRLARHF